MEKIRRLSANYIFPVSSAPIKNGIITINDNGLILSIDKLIDGFETYNTEFYNGIIVPGFINCHCHLELSYLQDVFNTNCGFSGFLNQMRNKRDINIDNAIDAASIYDSKMYKDGVSAIADIVNTDISLNAKKNSKIKYINFIELFGQDDSFANEIIEKGKYLKSIFKDSYISPHALYSLSQTLYNNLCELLKSNNLVSIHYKESIDEIEMIKNHCGKLFNLSQTNTACLNTNYSEMLKRLVSTSANLLLVHNAFADIEDIKFINKEFSNAYRVLCPLSNLFISDVLPPLHLFNKENICIGTDSLASNSTLSIISELFILQEAYKNLNIKDLLQFACINGAKALNIHNKFGSLEIGKQPGIVLIENFDFENCKLKKDSKSIRLA